MLCSSNVVSCFLWKQIIFFFFLNPLCDLLLPFRLPAPLRLASLTPASHTVKGQASGFVHTKGQQTTQLPHVSCATAVKYGQSCAPCRPNPCLWRSPWQWGLDSASTAPGVALVTASTQPLWGEGRDGWRGPEATARLPLLPPSSYFR